MFKIFFIIMTMVTHVAPKIRDICHVTIESLVEIQQSMQLIEDSTTGDVRVHVDKVSETVAQTLNVIETMCYSRL